MTTATINQKKVRLSIYEKALLLSVLQVLGQSGYTVTSGSDAHKAYHVSEDGSQCNCDSRVLCSHRIAVRTYKAERRAQAYQAECERRAAYVAMYDPCGLDL